MVKQWERQYLVPSGLQIEWLVREGKCQMQVGWDLEKTVQGHRLLVWGVTHTGRRQNLGHPFPCEQDKTFSQKQKSTKKAILIMRTEVNPGHGKRNQSYSGGQLSPRAGLISTQPHNTITAQLPTPLHIWGQNMTVWSYEWNAKLLISNASFFCRYTQRWFSNHGHWSNVWKRSAFWCWLNRWNELFWHLGTLVKWNQWKRWENHFKKIWTSTCKITNSSNQLLSSVSNPNLQTSPFFLVKVRSIWC